MKKLISFILAFILMISIGNAQKNDNVPVAVNSAATIALKVKDIASVVELSPERKVALINLLTKEQAALDSAINRAATTSQLLELKVKLNKELKIILTSEELEMYADKQRKTRVYKATPPL